MYSITINLNDKDEITNLDISKNKKISYSDLFDISGSLLGLVCVTILNGLSKAPDYTEEKSKADRAALYDNLVLLISMLSETIYPEYKDLKGDPEEFLKYMDERANELKSLEKDAVLNLINNLSDPELHSLVRTINTTLAERTLKNERKPHTSK